MSLSLRSMAVLTSFVVLGLVVVFGLGDALEPLLISFGLAYLSYPLIRWFERKGIRREFSVLAVILLIFLVAVGLSLLVIPMLLREVNSFMAGLPATASALLDKVEHVARNMGYEVEINRETIKSFIAERSSSLTTDLMKSSSAFATRVFSNVLYGALFVLNLALIPVFFFYLVNDYESISRDTWALVPVPWRPKLSRYTRITNQVLSGYVRGQLLVAVILAGLYGIAFVIAGLPFGFVIGIMTGLLNIIPYVGPFMGFTTAMLVGLASYSGPGSLIAPAIAFFVVQSLESFIITPKLVGDRVGLAVLPTMIALIIGGNLFGFIGMIVAVPVAGILRFVLIELKEEYRSLEFYKGS